MSDRYPYPLHPVGTRVVHNMAETLGVVEGHKDNQLIVRREDDGVVYQTSQWNWHAAEEKP